MTNHPEIPSPELSALAEVHNELTDLFRKDKRLNEYIINQEIFSITEEKGYQAINYYNYNLKDLNRNQLYGHVQLLVGSKFGVPHYNLSLESSPLVPHNDPHYYNPITIRAYSREPSVFLDIYPHQVQPEFDENEITNYRNFMSYHILGGDSKPAWHSMRIPMDRDGRYIGAYEYVDPLLSDQELTNMFFYSAAQGNMPGFVISNKNYVNFEPEVFSQYLPVH